MISLLIIFLLILMLLGLPLYLVILGATLLAFNLHDFKNPAIFIEMLRMSDAPALLAIPLFTLAGFILKSSKAPLRIITLSNYFLSWMPGGLAIVAIISCIVLTAFTGASGVTIIALGGILLPSLIKEKYSEEFSIGLLTASGSLGVKFPPSLPLILYAVISKLSIDKLFIACLIPGILEVLIISFYAVKSGLHLNKMDVTSIKKSSEKLSFKMFAELPLPFLVIGGIYSGMITITEASCIAAVYAVFIEVFILKEISIKSLIKTSIDAMVLTGSLFVILAAALSFTSYLVDARIPFQIIDFVKEYSNSKIAFLIFLNFFLLIVGCIMDIFSAIIIIVPLIHPVACELGINPFHLGVIFLTNLEIGYLTPPIGLNLFIAGKTFNKPVLQIYKSAFPFLLLRIISLVIITFLPILSLYLLGKL